MDIQKSNVEKIVITCASLTLNGALEYCSLGRYIITRIEAWRDGRYGEYTGQLRIEAERAAKEQ
jgi:hypothetical protein